ncbi:MAG: hypothetical protein Q9M24_08090 [Mariprofundaceae bacterium]|nr:hypothetical protein [Mariprofundaceae bacterium]
MRFDEAYVGWQGGQLTQAEAGCLLGMSERNFRRYVDRYRMEGETGLLDKRLTQASNRCAPVDEVLQLTDLYDSRYNGWNVKHFYSFYRREHDGQRSYTWVKTALQSAGMVRKAKGKGKHRKQRQRAPMEGMMLHQERLPKELAAAGIADMDEANAYLKHVYMPAFNAEFTVQAAMQASAFVQWFGGSLDDILCEQQERTVNKDNTVSFEGRVLQIPANEYRHHYVKARVRIHRYINGSLAIFHGPRRSAEFPAVTKSEISKPELPPQDIKATK